MSILILIMEQVRTQMVPEMLVHSPFNHLMRLLAREYIFEFIVCESFQL
jgi:hypothetical protein